MKTGFPLWWTGKMPGAHLLPGAPTGARVSPDSKLSPDKLGKVPCKLTSGGWVGFADWTEHEATLADVQRWHDWKATVLYQTKVAHAIDIDVDDEAVAASIEGTFKRVFGAAPVRYRDGSSRRLMLTAIADGEQPLRKRRIKFRIGDTEHAVELLGVGQQCVVEGPHPKGGRYQWRDGHPALLGLAGLPAVTKAKADAFFAEVADYLDLIGYPVVAQSQADNAAGTRQGLDNPALHAPSPELVFAALEKWHPDDMGHDDYVQALAAIKASLGPRADEFKGEVLAWSPGVRSTEDDQFEVRWNSIRESSLGWSWLSAQARKHGFNEDAQQDFDDAPAHDPENPDGSIPENPIDRMLARFIWCGQVEKYYDLKVHDFKTQTGLAAACTDVAPFGKTGPDSAAGVFQNNTKARKADLATFRPGRPIFFKEGDAFAVNTWRPGTLVPAQNVTDEDVKPWLDHVHALFGEGTATTKHVLDWQAFVLQRPGVKINHALLVYGERQGTGKDSTFAPLLAAVGEHNYQPIGPDNLQESFNTYLENQIIVVSEILNFDKRTVHNKLKPMLAAPVHWLTVNRKGVNHYKVPNVQNWLMFTNNENAVPLEDSDRRYFVAKCLLDAPRADDYYRRLWSWYEAGGTQRVVGWLLRRDVSAFSPKAPPPMTEAKATMIDLASPRQMQWVTEQLAEGGMFHGRELLSVKEIVRASVTDMDAPSGISEVRHVCPALRRAGYVNLKKVKLPDGSTLNTWARGDKAALYKQAEGKTIVERYAAEHNAAAKRRAA